jgi:hypothetical protein
MLKCFDARNVSLDMPNHEPRIRNYSIQRRIWRAQRSWSRHFLARLIHLFVITGPRRGAWPIATGLTSSLRSRNDKTKTACRGSQESVKYPGCVGRARGQPSALGATFLAALGLLYKNISADRCRAHLLRPQNFRAKSGAASLRPYNSWCKLRRRVIAARQTRARPQSQDSVSPPLD